MKTTSFSLRAALLSGLMALTLVSCHEKPVGLQTEYMTDPIGIDIANPRFSWHMETLRPRAAQTAFKVTVRDERGEVYSSGKVNSDQCVGWEYNGQPLRPRTRYSWNVEIWDEKGISHVSKDAFFETGLMQEGWNGAQWIGSKWPHFSKYRSKYNIEFDIQGLGTFLFGYRDSLNFVAVDFTESAIIFSHTTDGVRKEDGRVAWNAGSRMHHIMLKQSALDYAKGFRMKIVCDGTELTRDWITAQPYPLDVWKPYCRLYSIGFRGTAFFSGLKISEDVWNTTLYTSDRTFNGRENAIISPADENGAPMLKRVLNIDRPVRSARLYTTAQGIYEYFINGTRLSEDYFNPGSSDYRYRLFYSTYDLTPMLKEGNNNICAQLGAGWFSDFTGFATDWQDQFGTQLTLMAKIVIKYTDGSSETIITDDKWLANDSGPILSNSMQNGEDYDARREEYAGEWYPVSIYPAPKAEICAYVGSAARHNITLTAQSVSEPLPGVFVYDMGQNMVGVPHILLHGKEGQEITFRYGEMIYPDSVPEDPMPPLTAEVYAAKRGQVYYENYRGALSTDHYICAGKPEGEIFSPHFTFHGYRYIEIHGLEHALPLKDVQGYVIESIQSDQVMSSFETSDPHINRLYQNILWSQRGNFVSIPTDCPQRDERMGWSGDAQVFARTATYNMNVNAFYTRWIQSVRDAQGTDGNYCDYIPKVGVPPTGSQGGGGAMGWTEVGIVLPWQVYQQYGDERFIREHYPSMKAYMDYLDKRSVNGIQPGSGYGDWLAIDQTNTPLTNTAYWGYDAMLMSKMAYALGYMEDAEYYTRLHNRISDTFNRVFVDSLGRTRTADHLVPPYVEWFASGDFNMKLADTQTSYIVPMQAHLFNTTNHSLAVKHLVEDLKAHDYTLTTGFIGTPYLNLVLSENGYDSVAYKLFEQTAYPSWLYPVLQGATSIWERWNSYTIKRGFGMVDMNSFNHYSYGAIEEWMMTYCLGIQRDETRPGYKHFILQPRPGGTLKYAKGHYDTMYGRITSGWTKTAYGYRYKCIVPPNTTATLLLPEGDGTIRRRELKPGLHIFRILKLD